MTMGSLSLERAQAVFDYDQESGALFWKERPVSDFATSRAASAWNSRFAGALAGSLNVVLGYRLVGLEYRKYFEHRIIWLLAHGEEPRGQIDHINGDRSDNRIANLRDVHQQQNKMNIKKRSDNSSGVTGVSFCRARGKWISEACVGGKRFQLGAFELLDEAIKARLEANPILGFHENHGRSV